MATSERKVVTQAMNVLVGKCVVRVRYMTAAEAEDLMWLNRGVVLEFEGGVSVFTSCDEESNDAGVMFVETNDDELCLGRFPV